jgi:tetratricopeptide (TPR) repeat protein
MTGRLPSVADRHSGTVLAAGGVVAAVGGIFMGVKGFEPTKKPSTVWANSWFDVGLSVVILGLLIVAGGVFLHFRKDARGASTSTEAREIPIVVGDIPQEPPGYQPRANLSAALDQAGSGVSVVRAVTGMRGVGKTQLVAAYARAKLADGWRLIGWVNAGDSASLVADLIAVAEALKLSDGGSIKGGGAAGQLVRHRLEVDGRRCLVVFDDLADPDMLRPFLPAGGAARVLITSNRQAVAKLGASVPIDVFSADEALAFLTDQTGQADAVEAGAVARELGYLPLALAQAAGVIAAQHLTYATYLDRLRAVPVEKYLTRDEGQPYPHGVAAAILLSLDRARAGDQLGVCTGVMEIIAVLSDAGVRRDLLHAAGQAGVLASKKQEVSASVLDEALAKLAERSLLTFSLDRETVIVHRLIMRVVRDGLARQERFMAVCLNAAFVLNERAEALEGSQNRRAVRDLAEQVIALHDKMADTAGEAEEMAGMLLDLRSWALSSLNELGDSPPHAIVVGEALIADLTRVLGTDHPDTLGAQNDLASAYLDAGRAAEAIPLYEQTLTAQERVLGPDHLETLAARHNLAEAYREAGRAAKAIPLYEQARAAYERVLGPDHPITLLIRNNLALAYKQADPTANMIPLHEQVLADRKRVLGPDHPDTLRSRNNLAVAYWEAGRAADVIPLFEQLLADRERVLGHDHPDTLGSRYNLGLVYSDAGRAADAIPLFQQTLAAQEKVLGPDHPNTCSRGSISPRHTGTRAGSALSVEHLPSHCEERGKWAAASIRSWPSFRPAPRETDGRSRSRSSSRVRAPGRLDRSRLPCQHRRP